MDETATPLKPGHGDHWLAALSEDDPRLADALAPPLDAPEGLGFHRAPLTDALDMVQVTLRRRLVTAYPEPRATSLVQVRPRELLVWETRVEGWLVVDHPGAGTLNVFLTDLAAAAHRYAAARGKEGLRLEIGGLAYFAHPVRGAPGPAHLAPANRTDARFLPDDYVFEGEAVDVRPAGTGEVVDLRLHGGLELPVVSRLPTGARPGDPLKGCLWLTGRLPDA